MSLSVDAIVYTVDTYPRVEVDSFICMTLISRIDLSDVRDVSFFRSERKAELTASVADPDLDLHRFVLVCLNRIQIQYHLPAQYFLKIISR